METRTIALNDANSMIAGGTPFSASGINNATRLCDALWIPLVRSQPRFVYRQGWGNKCSDPKTVVATWYLKTMNRKNKQTIIPFDIVGGESRLTMGLNVRRFASTMILATPPVIKLKGPTYKQEKEFLTYIEKDNNNNFRTWVELVHHPKTSVESMMAIKTKPRRRTINIVKKVHGSTHAVIKDMVRLLRKVRYE